MNCKEFDVKLSSVQKRIEHMIHEYISETKKELIFKIEEVE